MTLLLDACSIIWLLKGSSSLSKAALIAIGEKSNTLYLPVPMLLEVEHQFQRGRFNHSALDVIETLASDRCKLLNFTAADLAYYPKGLEIFDSALVAMAGRLRTVHPHEVVAIVTADRQIQKIFDVIW